MKIEFHHPEKVDIDDIRTLAEFNQVRTSPHVGNLDQANNPHYLSLALAGVPLELVDTITSNDRNGRPSLLVKSGEEQSVDCGLTNKTKKKTHPCATTIGSTGLSLTQLHTAPLESAGIGFELSSRFPSRVHQDLPEVLVLAMARECPGLSLRVANTGIVSQDPKDRVSPSEGSLEELGVYGSSTPNSRDRLSGIVLPVQAIMVAEVVEQVLTGSDETVHIGGSDMVVYTREEPVRVIVQDLAKLTVEMLGLSSSQERFRFTVINKNGGVPGLDEESKKLAAELGFDNFSQHDLV